MSTRAEVCAVACAELFRDAGEIMISPMTNMASVGARLARLTFSPDILLTDGEAQLLADTSRAPATQPMPVCTTGCSTPTNSVSGVRNLMNVSLCRAALSDR